jgi:aminodeoxyfutalosine deaminase
MARELGLGAVPHAGEAAGADAIREAIDALGADRLRHGIRAIEDPDLVRELAERRIVLDVCPTSNVRTGVISSLRDHPLPALIDAGVLCSLSTDDPAMFDTDLGREHEAAIAMGVDPRALFDAGVAGALCDARTKEDLRRVGRWHLGP